MRLMAGAGGAIAILLAVILALAVGRTPAVPVVPTPQTETTVNARALADRLLNFWESAEPMPRLGLVDSEVEAMLKLVGRVVPGFRGDASILPERLRLAGALPLPGGFWLNGAAEVLPSENGLRMQGLRVGSLPLPPRTTLWLARTVGDLVLGERAASTLIEGIERVTIGEGEAEIAFALPLAARETIGAQLEALNRRTAVGVDVTAALALIDRLAEAQQRGELRRGGGSVVPWLQRALIDAPDGPTALLAVAIACGDWQVSRMVGWHRGPLPTGCWRATLGGRIDLRKHFVISAGLEVGAAVTSAVAVGELKELYDSREMGSGFSFDDIAANRAGIAFAQLVLSLDQAGRQSLAARLTDDWQVMPPFDDLSTGLSAAEFEARYGTIDSPAFAAAIDEIDRRIGTLPIHARVEG